MKYNSFYELEQHEQLNEDYSIEYNIGPLGQILILAPHGGGIEGVIGRSLQGNGWPGLVQSDIRVGAVSPVVS